MIFRKTTGRLLQLILICHIVFWLAAFSLQAAEPVNGFATEAKEQVSAYSQEPEGVKGVAVYYAKRFQGRRTHSGEIFDHKKLTAAHPSLPHGTRVKLINIANGKSVVVKVNDRCRIRRFELVDLTRAAAQKLGFYGKGAASVMIIPLTEG